MDKRTSYHSTKWCLAYKGRDSNDLLPQRIFAHSNDKLELIQMTHIEAKSVNKWLRYHLKQVKAVLKTAIIIVNRLKQLQGCCFSQYLSHFLMDFASLYLILKLIIGQIWHNRSFEYIRIFECPSEWMRYIRMFEYCSFTGNPRYKVSCPQGAPPGG